MPVWTFADALGTIRTLATVGSDGKWFQQHRGFDEFGGTANLPGNSSRIVGDSVFDLRERSVNCA